jgi:hypothetical protein
MLRKCRSTLPAEFQVTFPGRIDQIGLNMKWKTGKANLLLMAFSSVYVLGEGLLHSLPLGFR